MPQTKIVLGTLAEIEQALQDAIAAARARDRLGRVTVLVDNLLLKQQLPRRFAAEGLPQLNVRYCTADELASELAWSADGERRPRLARDAGRFLLREVAAGAAGYFAPVAGRDGFAEALGRLLRELELGGFTPETFASASDGGSGKLHELRRLFAGYRARHHGYALPGDAYRMAADVPLDGPLFVYGVWSLAQMQHDLLLRLASRSDVTVFLPATSTEADAAHQDLREALLAAGASIETPRPAAQNGASADARPPAPNVVLFSAPDTVREVWEAARWCLDRAREGTPFHEMAVVYRNRDPYRALVDEIFKEAEIETYLHDGRLLAEHPYGRRLLALLELAATHETFERAQVMEFLTETRLPAATLAKYPRFRPSEWETYTREAGVIEGARQWDERLTRLAAEKREESQSEGRDWYADVAQRIDVLREFIAGFHAALAERPDEATWDEHLAFARSLATRYAGDTAEILDALDDLRSIAAVRPRATFAEFCRAVRDDLEWRDTTRVLKEPVREFGRRGVAVVDASSLRHLRFSCVFLLGVAERAWPPPPRPDPLLLEHERRRINEAGGGSLPLRTEPDVEDLQFRLALQGARERLALSYARADAGRTARHIPSYFFRRVVEQLEGRALSLDDVERSRHVVRIDAGRLAAPALERSLSEAEYDRGLVRAATADGDAAGVGALERMSPTFASAVRARRARWSTALTRFDGVMGSEEAVAAARERSPFGRPGGVSASRLETYAACPYRYFSQYVLGLEPIDEPEAIDRMDHLQRGSLIHEILQRFLERVAPDGGPSPARRSEHLPLLIEIARDAGDDRERRGVTGRPLVWRMDRRAIDEDLVRWYDEECREAERSGLRPGAFEVRFGKLSYGSSSGESAMSTDDPLQLTVGGRTFTLVGRIDRIDWDDGLSRFRVIDYKTGKHYNLGMLERGEALQLPLYLHAAAQRLGIAAARGEAQYFYATSRGGFKRRGVSGADLETRRDDFDRVLTTVADGVDGGFFAPNPEHDHCRWCDFKDICDARIQPIMKRKLDDPRGAAYRALEAIE